MEPSAARARFSEARVARLATVRADGSPHLVPISFALAGDTLYTAVDHKPKRSRELQRLENIAANPAVCLLVDHYDEDWSQLWWARADGVARIAEPGDPAHARAVELLCARYAQYRGAPALGAAIVIDVTRFTGWRAAG
jgi:PPOX class probable F420-dependent enzyme